MYLDRQGNFTTRDDPVALTKHALRLLDRRLADEYGLYTRLGAELEYSFKNGTRPITMDKPMERQGILRPAAQKPATEAAVITTPDDTPHTLWVTDPLFPTSPVVTYSYKESGSSQFETVISHEGTHDRLRPEQGRSVTFARAIEALRNTLHSAHTRADAPAFTPIPDLKGQSRMRRFETRIGPPTPEDLEQYRDDNDREKKYSAQNAILKKLAPHAPISTDAFWRGITQGMHINVSLCHTGPAWESRGKTHRMAITDALTKGIANITSEGAYLLLPSQSAADRLLERKGHIGTTEIKSLRDRIENKRPSAECNPYYATLLTQLGIFHALREGAFNRQYQSMENPNPTLYYPLPANVAELQAAKANAPDFRERFFLGHGLIQRHLNELEPDLGTRFLRAIERTPPGMEHARPVHGR